MMSVFPRIPQTGLSRKESQKTKETVFEQQKAAHTIITATSQTLLHVVAELTNSLLWTTVEI